MMRARATRELMYFGIYGLVKQGERTTFGRLSIQNIGGLHRAPPQVGSASWPLSTGPEDGRLCEAGRRSRERRQEPER